MSLKVLIMHSNPSLIQTVVASAYLWLNRRVRQAAAPYWMAALGYSAHPGQQVYGITLTSRHALPTQTVSSDLLIRQMRSVLSQLFRPARRSSLQVVLRPAMG